MNDDLISRSALLAAIVESGILPAMVRRTIERAPAVDAVPVVRCQDCKNTREKTEYESSLYIDEALVCTRPDEFFGYPESEIVLPDHFCSYGERR